MDAIWAFVSPCDASFSTCAGSIGVFFRPGFLGAFLAAAFLLGAFLAGAFLVALRLAIGPTRGLERTGRNRTALSRLVVERIADYALHALGIGL